MLTSSGVRGARVATPLTPERLRSTPLRPPTGRERQAIAILVSARIARGAPSRFWCATLLVTVVIAVGTAERLFVMSTWKVTPLAVQ